ncbi:MAG: hypothetical protein ACRCW3_03765 [Metamycoplasmataceae bacterium]
MTLFEKKPKKPQKPDKDEVKKYLDYKDKEGDYQNYFDTINSMKKLFSEKFKNNDNLEDILIKVACVNQLYSTNVKYLHSVARHIAENIKNIDTRLSAEELDLELVDDIANVKINDKKTINYFSFATKYCHLHSNDKYSIYDSYVAKILCYFNENANENDKFIKDELERKLGGKLTDKKLRKYSVFHEVIEAFIEHFKLREHKEYSRQEIDRYLWLLGKELFPRKIDVNKEQEELLSKLLDLKSSKKPISYDPDGMDKKIFNQLKSKGIIEPIKEDDQIFEIAVYIEEN